MRCRAPPMVCSRRLRPTRAAGASVRKAKWATWLASVVLALLLVACAAVPPQAGTSAHCADTFARVDAAVAREGVRDAMTTRIDGFPHLRVDRLLASFRDQLGDDAGLAYWVAQLARLDAEARAVELANLAPTTRAALDADHAAGVTATLARCRERMITDDLRQPARIAVLREAAVVPDDYSLVLRALGLYPLTRIPFAAGVRAFERRVAATFAAGADALPMLGELGRYAPLNAAAPSRDAVARQVRAAAGNPLAIPYLDAGRLEALARAHAPVFEIEVLDDDDRIGEPYWPAHGPARIDTARLVVFYRQAHARAGGQVLLQLVYTAWFPARPRQGRIDLLAGHLDALVWRVTLARDGEPLLYDSMHACGCYHFFFPTPRVRARPAARTLDEWLFVPHELRRPAARERVVLRVASRTHYLRAVRFETAVSADVRTYALRDDDALRSLPAPTGRRSLFGADGLVAGSERLERFVFWPMGIRSAGAMRQWGRHATAFVGRRHFDDPYLIDARFEILATPPEPAAPH